MLCSQLHLQWGYLVLCVLLVRNKEVFAFGFLLGKFPAGRVVIPVIFDVGHQKRKELKIGKILRCGW